VAGNQPYTNITGSLLSLTTTPKNVYASSSVVTATTTAKYLIMLNATFTLPSGASGNHGVQFTVGRYTSSTPLSTQAINIVSGSSSISSSFPASTMTGWPSINDAGGSTINSSASAIDTPGTAATYYYTVWAYSDANMTLTGMNIFLSVLQVSN
jgi:hypothetical protein